MSKEQVNKEVRAIYERAKARLDQAALQAAATPSARGAGGGAAAMSAEAAAASTGGAGGSGKEPVRIYIDEEG